MTAAERAYEYWEASHPRFCEKWNPDYQAGVSEVEMPNGSRACVSHAAPVELQVSMSLAWAEAWGWVDE